MIFRNKKFKLAYEEVLTKEAFSNYTYKQPKNKEQLLFDFYVLNMLPIWKLEHKHGGKDNKELVFIIKENQKELNNKLKPHLLFAVFFSICAEFRHILGDSVNADFYKILYDSAPADVRAKALESLLKQINQPKYNNLIKKYISLYAFEKANLQALDAILKGKPKKEITPREIKRDANSGILDEVSDEYLKSFRAAYKASGASKPFIDDSFFDNVLDFVRLAKIVFSELDWFDGYGGDNWADICVGWLNLHKATTNNEIMMRIDQVYHLQHNTDTVFNKIKSYAMAGGFSWVKKALDFKRDAKSVIELWPKASPQLKPFAAFVIKHAEGKTVEQYFSEKDLANFGDVIGSKGSSEKPGSSKMIDDIKASEKIRINIEDEPELEAAFTDFIVNYKLKYILSTEQLVGSMLKKEAKKHKLILDGSYDEDEKLYVFQSLTGTKENIKKFLVSVLKMKSEKSIDIILNSSEMKEHFFAFLSLENVNKILRNFQDNFYSSFEKFLEEEWNYISAFNVPNDGKILRASTKYTLQQFFLVELNVSRHSIPFMSKSEIEIVPGIFDKNNWIGFI